MKQHVFEKGDKLYIVGNVSPFKPGGEEIEEYAFAQELQKMAPNENLLWLRGNYVAGDTPNKNGQMWTSGELAIKSLTPMFMPVTVMHDVRTAVGLIADTKLITPAADETAKRARIDTSLAVWAHRFPEVAEEVAHNYEQGTLMQSMECVAPHYSCGECGQVFQKLPKGEEQANWCAHLKESPTAVRILGNVVFTGTGLIFGSRGSTGANAEAHLEVFQDEIAEFHERAHDTTTRKPKPRSKNRMEIEDSRYQELLAAEEKAKRLPDVEAARDEAVTKLGDAETRIETLEGEKAQAETAREEAEKKLTDAEEKANQQKLREERFDALGEGFKAKLGEVTKKRLTEQAETFSEEEWTSRLDELAEAYGVKPDADKDKKDGETGDGEGATFTAEELAATGAGRTGGDGGETGEVSPASRQSVVAGLFETAKQ